RLRPADPLGHLAEGELELVEERRVGTRLLDRGEVLARDVFDEREEEGVRFVGLAEERGQRVQAGLAGGAPATLTGDELVAAFRTRPDHDRLTGSPAEETPGAGTQTH